MQLQTRMSRPWRRQLMRLLRIEEAKRWIVERESLRSTPSMCSIEVWARRLAASSSSILTVAFTSSECYKRRLKRVIPTKIMSMRKISRTTSDTRNTWRSSKLLSNQLKRTPKSQIRIWRSISPRILGQTTSDRLWSMTWKLRESRIWKSWHHVSSSNASWRETWKTCSMVKQDQKRRALMPPEMIQIREIWKEDISIGARHRESSRTTIGRIASLDSKPSMTWLRRRAEKRTTFTRSSSSRLKRGQGWPISTTKWLTHREKRNLSRMNVLKSLGK